MTWWRNLGGLMAACVLALMVVGPAVGMAGCLCEDAAPLAGVEASAVAVQSLQNDRQDHGGAPCEAVYCVGGHCHHGGAMLDVVVAAVPAPAVAVGAPAMSPVRALVSRPASGLDRPPRA